MCVCLCVHASAHLWVCGFMGPKEERSLTLFLPEPGADFPARLMSQQAPGICLSLSPTVLGLHAHPTRFSLLVRTGDLNSWLQCFSKKSTLTHGAISPDLLLIFKCLFFYTWVISCDPSHSPAGASSMVLRPPQVHDPSPTVSRSRELVGEDEVKSLVAQLERPSIMVLVCSAKALRQNCPSSFPDQSCFPLSGGCQLLCPEAMFSEES